MKIFAVLVMLIISVFVYSEDLTDTTLDLVNDELVSMEVKNGFDKKFYGPVKEFFFYKGKTLLTEREFELLVLDPAIRENKKKLREVSNSGFGSSFVLGGLATAFLIPSIVFVITQTNYSKIPGIYENYTSWIDYYSKNYDYAILPGVINIGLTFVFSTAAIINLAVTFSLVNKYKYNELLYREIIENYNRKVRKRYAVIPNLSILNFGEDNQSLSFGLKITL